MAYQYDFTQTGGYPLTQDSLDRLQIAYQEIGDAFASFYPSDGKVYIISGLENTGVDGTGEPLYSNGWAVHNGKVFFVEGGAGKYIRLESPQDSVTFNDGVTHPVYQREFFKVGLTPYFTIKNQCVWNYFGMPPKQVINIGLIQGVELVKQGNIVFMRFPSGIQLSSAQQGNIPVDFRPTQTTITFIHRIGGTSYNPNRVIIEANGDIIVEAIPSGFLANGGSQTINYMI